MIGRNHEGHEGEALDEGLGLRDLEVDPNCRGHDERKAGDDGEDGHLEGESEGPQELGIGEDTLVRGESQDALPPSQREKEGGQEGKEEIDETEGEPEPGESLADRAGAAHVTHLEASLCSQV